MSEANATAACLFFDTVKWCTYKLNLRVKKNPELADMLASFYLGANVSNYGDQAATFTFTNPQIADEFAASNPGSK